MCVAESKRWFAPVLFIAQTVICKPMKKILPIILLFLLCNCKEKNKKEIVSEKPTINKEKIERKNEVIITVNDTIKSFFTNLFVSQFQDKPDMLFMGKKEKRLSVTIPTTNSIKILGGDPFF